MRWRRVQSEVHFAMAGWGRGMVERSPGESNQEVATSSVLVPCRWRLFAARDGQHRQELRPSSSACAFFLKRAGGGRTSIAGSKPCRLLSSDGKDAADACEKRQRLHDQKAWLAVVSTYGGNAASLDEARTPNGEMRCARPECDVHGSSSSVGGAKWKKRGEASERSNEIAGKEHNLNMRRQLEQKGAFEDRARRSTRWH
mmetsp:Transcript_36023/g.75756  ORF Transcript_36023/g.75756 Transcript_36023/m.75756 type:complete len:200 (+) Transcript_36023:548-1147(+)